MKKIIVAACSAFLVIASLMISTTSHARGYSSTRMSTSSYSTRSYSSPSRTSSFGSKSRSKMRSSSIPKSSTKRFKSYSYKPYRSDRSYQYGGGNSGMSNTLITGALLYMIMSDNNTAQASPEQRQAVNQQFKNCVTETGYEGTQAQAGELLKTEAGLTEKQKEMKACMLPDDSGSFGSILSWLVLLSTLGVGLVVGFQVFSFFRNRR